VDKILDRARRQHASVGIEQIDPSALAARAAQDSHSTLAAEQRRQTIEL
jgi:hypothetical protein